MEIIETTKKLAALYRFMSSQGYEIEEIRDLSKISATVSELKKPYLTPMSDVSHNDFTTSDLICLVARKNGVPVMLGCARLESIGDEPVSHFWRRVFKRAYGGDLDQEVIGTVRPEVEQAMRNRLVYFGDLYVAAHGDRGRLPIRAFVSIGHLAVSLKWNPDWTYCFIRERDALRGAHDLYGFNHNFGHAFEWLREPPAPRDRSELLMAVSRSDQIMMTGRTVVAVAKDSEIKQSGDKN